MALTVAARDAQTAAEKARSKALDEYYYDHLELVPDGAKRARDFLTLSLANASSVEKAVRPLVDRFAAQRQRQTELVQRLQLLSPAIMARLVLNEASGTSTARHEDFMRQVEIYQHEWKEFFASRLLARKPLTSADYDQMPQFRYRPEPWLTPLQRVAGSLVAMVAALLLVAGIGFVDLRRYQVAPA